MTVPNTDRPSPSDDPITTAAQDQLQRVGFVEALAREVLSVPAEQGFVFGLLGPWGCGKSSLLNLLEERLDTTDVLVLRFNPWLFSGAEQLVLRFFGEIAAQLRSRKDERLLTIAGLLDKYGEAVGSIAVPWWLKVTTKPVGWWAKRLRRGREWPTSTHDQRAATADRLKSLGRRIIVMIDDIDRLPKDEVLEVLRLVRLTGDFPNIIYLLAFDYDRVARMLDENAAHDGRSYLEKIVQLTQEVPAIRPSVLQNILLADLNDLSSRFTTGPFHLDQWQNLFHCVMRPLFRTVRDVRRYIATLHVTLPAIGDEIAVADVFALEAIRLKVPRLAALLAEHRALLTEQQQHDRNNTAKTALEAMIAQGEPFAEQMREMLTRLFPFTQAHLSNRHYGPESLQSWSKERRVAHPRVLQFYLERTLPPEVLSATRVQEVFDALTDSDRLHALLDPRDGVALEQLLERVEDYERDFPPEAARSAIPVLLNLQPRLRHGRGQGFSDFGADLKLDRVILRLLRRVSDEADRLAIVKERPQWRAHTRTAVPEAHPDSPQRLLEHASERSSSRACTGSPKAVPQRLVHRPHHPGRTRAGLPQPHECRAPHHCRCVREVRGNARGAGRTRADARDPRIDAVQGPGRVTG